MKKLAIISMMMLSIISCKEKASKSNATSGDKEDVSTVGTQIPLKTYAEISIKEGGHWEDREYIDGHFKNVNAVNVPAEHTDHSWFLRYEGPGWENNQIGYRLYLDWRNAIDIYGKKVDSLVLPYVGQDGFDSYHEDADWGQDILKAGKSMGIGGYGRIVADTVAHFRTVENTSATVENTDDSSSVAIGYKGWSTGNETIDLNAVLTIYKQDRYTKATLTPSKAITGVCTGIVKHGIPLQKKEGEEWAYIATYGEQTLVSPPDNLGMAVFYKLDEVAEQKEGKDDFLVIFKPTTTAISYYFLGAWEQEKNGIKDKASFYLDLDKKLQTLENKGQLN